VQEICAGKVRNIVLLGSKAGADPGKCVSACQDLKGSFPCAQRVLHEKNVEGLGLCQSTRAVRGKYALHITMNSLASLDATWVYYSLLLLSKTSQQFLPMRNILRSGYCLLKPVYILKTRHCSLHIYRTLNNAYCKVDFKSAAAPSAICITVLKPLCSTVH
jgi:hypothetical protein